MAGNRLQSFFGDDLEETWDSLRSVPGAFGNIIVAVVRQVRPIDAAAFSLVLAGLAWILFGYLVLGEHHTGLLLISVLPLALWLVAGIVGGFVFHIGAIGRSSLAYWESYMLIVFFALFGVISLRLALDPRDRRVYHATPPSR
jgi:hypothetical protein